MKPRLKAAPLTDQDKYANTVFAVLRGVTEFRGCVLVTSYDADRRDADLMWKAQQARVGHWGPVIRYELGPDETYFYVWCGGAQPGTYAIDWNLAHNITYFA